MHESTKQKIDDYLENGYMRYLATMLFARRNKFWSDSVEEIEQYIAQKTILKDEV